MACQKSLDFAAPPGSDAHLSYYWTMDEAGDLDKVDSAAGHVWTTKATTLSPAGLFSNGVQLDCIQPGNLFRGLNISSDTGLAFDATTSKGLSVWFWVKQTVDSSGSIVNPFAEWSIEIHDAGFTVDAEMFIQWSRVPASGRLVHEDFTAGNTYTTNFAFAPVLGAWHMLAGTVDLVNHTLNAYVDGVLVATSADIGHFYTAPSGDNLLRYDYGGGVNTGELIVDEFGLSLKGALTAAQVLALYNGGAGMTWPAIAVVVPYP